MKKALYVNISIISLLVLSHTLTIMQNRIFATVPSIIALMVIIRVRHIFISRENTVGKRSRTALILLIVLSYVCNAGLYCANILALPQDIPDYIAYGMISLYIALIAVYLCALFENSTGRLEDKRDA